MEMTLDDVNEADTCVRQLMHVAKHGSDGKGSIPTVAVPWDDERQIELDLPQSLRNLSCGPICTVVDLHDGFVPPLYLFPAVAELVRDTERMSRDCVDLRIVIVSESNADMIHRIVRAAGGVRAVFVTSERAAYEYMHTYMAEQDE